MEQTLDSPRDGRVELNIFSHFGKFVGIPLLIYSHMAITVQKGGGGGGGTLIVLYMRRLGAFF